jgi:hypothetical protein
LALGFQLRADRGIDMDTDELSKSIRHAAFIKNMSRYAKDNPAVQQGSEGDNANAFTPNEAHQLLGPIPGAPAGDNYCCGFKEDPELNEAYVFVFNTRGDHFIYRINGDGTMQMVKVDRDFNFQLDPRFFINQRRCAIFAYKVFNRATGRDEMRKDMVFTDNNGPLRYLNIEDCIATAGFDPVRFPFFRHIKPYNEYLINHGLPYSFACIGVTPLPTSDADRYKENRLDFRSIRFRIKRFDVWNRESEHGVISQPYYSTTAACLSSSTGRPRCLELSIEKGPPTISKLQLEVSFCSANAQDFTVDTDWMIYDTIEIYDQTNPSLQWWERPLNPDLKYDKLTDRIAYNFCNDKSCTPIPKSETNRNENPIPITAGSAVAQNNCLVTANDRRKYPPLNKSVLKNLSFSIEKPKKETLCRPKSINITVYAVIICPMEEENRVISIRKDQDNIIFGADKTTIIYEIGQVFPKGQEGFIGYFAGSSDYVISKQAAYNPSTGELIDTGVDLSSLTLQQQISMIAIQKFEFKNVAPGTKVFRIASHKASPVDDFRKTSTTAYGTTSLKDHKILPATWGPELIIDACEEKDLDLRDTAMVIVDMTSEEGGIRRITNTVSGYLYEDEVNKIPVEHARVDTTEGTWHSLYTDHNGYYFAVARSKGWRGQFFGRKDGKVNQLLKQTQQTTDSPGARFRVENLYVYEGTQEYKAADRVLLKGRVLLCDNITGVGGVSVILTHGAVATTDSNGNYSIVVHDGEESKARTEKIVIVQGGKCILSTCGTSCASCFPKITFTAPAYNGQPRTSNVAPTLVSIQNFNLRGPQNGGRYEMSLQAFDWLGRSIGAEGLPWFIDLPSIQETGVFGFSKIKYAFAANAVFPTYVRHLTIAIGRNLNWSDFLTWYVEKVDFVDNAGNVNKVNPTQIKLYYRGMLEYNLQNGLSTNATWQIIDPVDNTMVTGDRVEFIANGDGKIFSQKVIALVKHDKEGQFFTIDYVEELKDLSDGAMIKIMRPRQCTTVERFSEQCLEIELVPGANGNTIPAGRASGYIDFFDAYMFNRQIPIPHYDENNEKVPSMAQIKNIPIPFEHHSPSDFWGDHCSSRGRFFAKNPYANTQYLSTEIAVSKAMVNDGVIHGISYFDEKDFKVFDKNEWGGITYLVPMIRMFLVICEHDNFVVPFDDDAVRVRADNTVAATGAENRFGNPERKNGSKYGCQPDDINTICEHKGAVMYLDSSQSAWVYNELGNAADVSVLGISGWIKDKVKEAIQFNRSSTEYRKYFHATFDPRSEQCLLTSFKLPIYKKDATKQLATADYVNTARQVQLELNETMAINPFVKEVVQMYSFTPEYFGTLRGHIWDKQLISFKNGQAWLHHKTFRNTSPSYMKYFGVQCEPIYEVVLNVEASKSKIYLFNQVFCKEQLFFCDRILTHAGQRSRLLKSQFSRMLDFWSADFKGDLNTITDANSQGLSDPSRKLYEGDTLYGNWIKVRYVGDPKANGRYFEFNGVTIHVIGVEKSGT